LEILKERIEMKLKAVSRIVLPLLLTSLLTLAFSIQPVEAAVSPYSPAGGIKLTGEQYTARVLQN
jgi:hypothetical protein